MAVSGRDYHRIAISSYNRDGCKTNRLLCVVVVVVSRPAGTELLAAEKNVWRCKDNGSKEFYVLF